MTWTRPPLRTRFLKGTNWRKQKAAQDAILAPPPRVPPAFAGLGETPAVAYTVHGRDTDQVRQKVDILRECVVAPALGPGPRGTEFLRDLLTQILGAAPRTVNSNRKGWLAAYLFSWIQSRVRYVNDPLSLEIFTQIPELLKRGYGDCDDLAAMVAALFGAVGIPVRCRVIKTRNTEGWSHIYPIAFLDGAWRAFDASVPDARPGWEFRDRTALLDLELQP